jgi:large subunit ribosomal protein L6
MSRIGRLPIKVPAGVTVTVGDGNAVAVKGPKGQLSQKIHADMTISQEGGIITVTRPSDEKAHRALHGLSRTLINNMVVGVTEGFSKNLELVGTGYRAAVNGKKLTLTVGYSHPVEFDPPKDVTFETPAPNRITVKGIDKQVVGMLAANIRDVRPPEPYLGKGIKYEGEFVRRKAGKAGKK